MSYDYATMMERGWVEVDIRVDVCDGCGKRRVLKVMKRGADILRICEDCFVDDTGRFEPIEKT